MPPDSNTDPVASVIIPAHNAQDTIVRQLEALAQQVEHPEFEVIIVANQCSDDTISICQEFRDRLNLKIIEANEKASAGYARNVGVQHAVGDVLLFCDADDEVQPEWVGAMVEPLSAGRANFVGGLIELDTSKLPSWIYHWRYAHRVDHRVFISDKPLPHLLTASLGVTRAAFTDVNGFDETFPGAAGEDMLIVRSLFRAGHRFGSAPRARVRYTPRTDFISSLTQANAYHFASRILSELEGRNWVRSSLAGRMKHALFRTASIVRSRRFFHPLLPVALLAESTSAWRIDRAWKRSVLARSEPTPSHDVCISIEAPLIGGLAFRVPSMSQGPYFQTSKGAEQGTLRLIEMLLPVGGYMVDVGANVGLLTVAAAHKAGPLGEIVAFEPGTEARMSLITNVHRHKVTKNVSVNSQAVGSESSQKVLYTYANSLLSGFAEALDSYGPGDPIRHDLVDVVALDDVISKSIDLLKIDVEGFELDVLLGAHDVMERSPRLAVIFELNFPILRALDRSPVDILAHFPPTTWRLFDIDEENFIAPLTPLDGKQIEEDSLSSDRYFNVLAVRLDQTGRIDSLIRG